MKQRILILLLVTILLFLNSCSHKHAFSDEYSFNDTHHWYECGCGEKNETSVHRFDVGKFNNVPNDDGNYVKTFTCLECGAIKEEYFDASVTWYDDEQVDLDYAYSFAIVGDTQVLCQKYPQKMEAIYDWILENKDSKKIAHVFGLGDITEGIWEVSNTDGEWTNAKSFITKLDGVIPYSLVRGNHDQIDYFEKYFANSTYMSQFDGFMNGDDISNSYKLFTVGSTDYMFVTLDYGASDDVLEWANEIIANHPNHKVIITTHAYLYRDGTTLSTGDTALPSDHSDADNSPMKIYNDGQQIWEKLVSKHPNILLVLSGHDPCDNVVTLQSVGAHGNVVTQMLIDPQGMDADMGGTGMVCMLYFSEDGSKMEVEWFSTDRNQYYKYINQYTVDLSGGSSESHTLHSEQSLTHHYYACDCGFVYKKEAHEFGGGTSCSCGFSKVDFENVTFTTSFITIDGELLQTVQTKANKNGLCEVIAPEFDGYVAEYDRYVYSVNHDALNNVIYCSPLSIWDGVSVSKSLEGSGTENDPYLIQTAEDFVYLKKGEFSKQFFKLMTSIDLGDHSFSFNTFDGIIDGNHCSIRGINVSSSSNNTGLFSVLQSSSIIYNLSLYGEISGAQYTGALAGVTYGEVDNVVNFANVYGAGNLGGVVGNSANTSRIYNCVNYGSVNGTSWNNGGVIGFAQNMVLNCVNHGSVTTTGDCAGGVVGSSHSFISHCINYGTVKAPGRAGGIAYNSKKLIDHCTNYGDVNGSWDLGGILGFVAADYTAVISNCVNNGNVSGTTGVGGIFGFTADTAVLNIENCTNNGNVAATWGGGGIAGNVNTNTEISGCINNGNVNGNGELGGIVGKCKGKVTNCTNNGTIKGTTDIIGGIVGHLQNATHIDIISTTNKNNGTVSGPNANDIIGKSV